MYSLGSLMEEVKPLSNKLLDSVLRDVIDNGSVSFSVQDSPCALDKKRVLKACKLDH